MRVLLTGGLGYLGGRLAGVLAAQAGHEVLLGTRTPQRAPHWAASYQLICTDWSAESALARACSGVDAVVHLAAMNARQCAADPQGALAFNGLATARLVSAACHEHVRRFIYVSTAHVYGSALVGIVDENSCPDPRHPYATSHRAAEDVVRHAQRAGLIEGLVVRLSNCYGAPADTNSDCWTLLVNDLCLQAVRTRRLALQTTGGQRRDFMPLGDACRALAQLLAAPATLCREELLNVGGGWAPTLREMAGLIAARVAATLGFYPELHTAERSDAVGNGLIEYRIARLLATGFAPEQDSRVTELDRLIRFCQQHCEALP